MGCWNALFVLAKSSSSPTKLIFSFFSKGRNVETEVKWQSLVLPFLSLFFLLSVPSFLLLIYVLFIIMLLHKCIYLYVRIFIGLFSFSLSLSLCWVFFCFSISIFVGFLYPRTRHLAVTPVTFYPFGETTGHHLKIKGMK